MKFLTFGKDGGADSPVDGLFLIEIKSLFSIVLLKFNKGSREVYHSHAFNAISWFLKGNITEHCLNMSTGEQTKKTWRGLSKLKYTPRNHLHLVEAHENTYCITFRGAWAKTWFEYSEKENKLITLTHGRKEI